MDLKQLLSTAEQNYASIRNKIRDHVTVVRLYSRRRDFPSLTKCSLKAEKIHHEAERVLEKNEVLFETVRIASELREVAETVQDFIVVKFASDVEFPSLVKLSRPVAKIPALVIINSPERFIFKQGAQSRGKFFN